MAQAVVDFPEPVEPSIEMFMAFVMPDRYQLWASKLKGDPSGRSPITGPPASGAAEVSQGQAVAAAIDEMGAALLGLSVTASHPVLRLGPWLEAERGGAMTRERRFLIASRQGESR